MINFKRFKTTVRLFNFVNKNIYLYTYEYKYLVSGKIINERQNINDDLIWILK